MSAKLFGDGNVSPLCWTLPSAVNELEPVARIQQWHSAARAEKKLPSTADSIVVAVDRFSNNRIDIETALEAIGAAHSLGWLCDYVDEVAWQLTADRLVSFAAECNIDYQQQPWLHQLCEVELPLTLSHQLTEFPPIRKSGKQAFKRMSRLVAEILDGDGWPASVCLSSFGPLMASWARCLALARELKLKVSKKTMLQLEWAVRQAIRLARPDGTFLGSDHKSNPFTTDFVQALMRVTPDRHDRKIAAKCLKTADTSKNKSRLGRLPEASGFSEWARVGVLQSDWKRNACKLALAWGARRSWFEISRQASLIEGDCTPHVAINGSRLFADSEFELVCESLDDEIDYLELQLHLANDVSLYRQVIFGKQDQFALFSDVIHCSEPARIEYRCEFPLSPGMNALAESETREFYLRDQKIRSLVLPLALPEWKTARSDNCFACENNRLVLQQTTQGQGLCAALFFDLNPKRSVKPRTWRQLTVAEMLKIVEHDVAVAYRIQVGKDQWVFYRSVGSKSNRSFIGQNVVDEFYFGRFHAGGEMKELLLIE